VPVGVGVPVLVGSGVFVGAIVGPQLNQQNVGLAVGVALGIGVRVAGRQHPVGPGLAVGGGVGAPGGGVGKVVGTGVVVLIACGQNPVIVPFNSLMPVTSHTGCTTGGPEHGHSGMRGLLLPLMSFPGGP